MISSSLQYADFVSFATVRAGYPLQITHSVGHERCCAHVPAVADKHRSGVTTSGEYSSFPRVILYIPPRQMFGLMAICKLISCGSGLTLYSLRGARFLQSSVMAEDAC